MSGDTHFQFSRRPNDFQKSTGFLFYELDIARDAGTQWSQRKDLAAAVPQFYENNLVLATVVVPLPEYGVIMFMGHSKVWIYKHSGTARGK